MKTKKATAFDYVLVLIFVLICFIMIIPIYKVLIDSLDLRTAYGMKLFPEEFGLAGYESVFTNPTLYRPFLVSCLTTVAGTFCGLAISTLGAYVLIQWNMPGRNFFANLLPFTTTFTGGMIPTYLVMRSLYLHDTLWAVLLLPAITFYNLVLLRNFFD